jgi:hypothetical protein
MLKEDKRLFPLSHQTAIAAEGLSHPMGSPEEMLLLWQLHQQQEQ